MCHKRLLLWCLIRYESVTCTVHFIRYYLGFEYVVKYCYRLLQNGTRAPRITTPHGCQYLRTFIVPTPTTTLFCFKGRYFDKLPPPGPLGLIAHVTR